MDHELAARIKDRNFGAGAFHRKKLAGKPKLVSRTMYCNEYAQRNELSRMPETAKMVLDLLDFKPNGGSFVIILTLET